MAIAMHKTVKPATLLRLGRVSNLPTIWTNVIAATVLAGGEWQSWRTGIVLLAMSLFYVAGMYLNDFFDRAIDAAQRSERPIPAGEISAAAVAAIGFGMLAAALAILASRGIAAATVGMLLAACIVGYDVFHKGNPLAPVVMGACRALVYGGAAVAAAGGVSGSILIMALALLAYVAGLTYAARQESLNHVGNLWPLLLLSAPMLVGLPSLQQGVVAAAIYAAMVGATVYATFLLARRPMAGAVPRAVSLLIAGISLVDAAFLAAAGAVVPALLAVGGYGATLVSQRYIAGT